MRSRYDASDSTYLKSWVLEGSLNNSNEWKELDRRENDSSLNGQNQINLFPVARSDAFRCIRLRQTGNNHYSQSDNRMVISGFELFGFLME
jgi:hypothetical protein